VGCVWRRSEGGDENQRGEEREMAIGLGGSRREGGKKKGLGKITRMPLFHFCLKLVNNRYH